MSGWLKFLLYFFIIVSVLKYYETKLNDDKQIEIETIENRVSSPVHINNDHLNDIS